MYCVYLYVIEDEGGTHTGRRMELKIHFDNDLAFAETDTRVHYYCRDTWGVCISSVNYNRRERGRVRYQHGLFWHRPSLFPVAAVSVCY